MEQLETNWTPAQNTLQHVSGKKTGISSLTPLTADCSIIDKPQYFLESELPWLLSVAF